MKLRIDFLLPILCVLLLGCGGEGDERRSRNEATDKTLRINLGQKPKTLDPSLMTDVVGGITIKSLIEGLVDYDENGNEVGRAAERWEHDETYTVWTFHLRKDGRWHNGDPVTAHDFVYAIERICTPSVRSQYASYTYEFLEGGTKFYEDGGLDSGKSLAAVQAIDDHTVQYRLAMPVPFFISVMQLAPWYPLNKKAIDAGGGAWAESPETFVGNGPFRLTENRANDVIAVTKWKDYREADQIFWDRVEFYSIESEATENSAFLGDQLDITLNVSIPELDYWRERPEFRSIQYFATEYTGFNTSRPPFDDVRVRKAFSKAVDRDLIVTRVTRRGEPTAKGLVPSPLTSPRGGDYRDHAGDYVGPRDVEGARALFKEAGYGEGGKPFPLVEYMYNTAEENKAVAEQLQSMWREVLGVDVRLQNVEWGVRIERTRSKNYDLARQNWYGDYLDPMTFLELFATGNSQNNTGYSNPRYDELLTKARQEGDAAVREQYLIDAERILVQEDCVVAPLFYFKRPMLVRDDLEGIGRNVTGGLDFVRARRK